MRALLLWMGMCLAAASCAQETPAVRRLGSVYVGGGGSLGMDPFFSRSDIPSFTRGSKLLDRDLSDHVFFFDGPTMGEGIVDLAISVFPCGSADRVGPELRVGVIYGSGPSFGGVLTRTTYTPYDTLTSAQTGEQVFVDSVNRSVYLLEYKAERLGLHGSLIWRRQGRWSLYGGVGLMGGVIMNARSYVRHDVYAYTENDMSRPWGYANGAAYDEREETEAFRNDTGWWLGAELPLGLDWRAATVSPFWSRIHFCYEVRPQLTLQNIPELQPSTGVGVQALFVTRVEL